MTSLPLSEQVNFGVDLMISNRHVHIIYIGLAFPKKKSWKLIDM